MDGDNCPKCSRPSHWLSTTNQWEFYCPTCDFRFNEKGEIQDKETGDAKETPA